MKKKVSILLFIILCTTGNLHAMTITESIWAEVTESSVGDVSAGMNIHLFDVTYDNEGTQYHTYNLDGSVFETVTLDSTHLFFSDADFQLSETLTELISKYGIYDENDTYSNNVSESLKDWVRYYSWDATYDLGVGLSDVWTDDQAGELIIYAGEETNKVEFGNFSTSQPVPEPSTMFLFGVGLLGLVRVKQRSQK